MPTPPDAGPDALPGLRDRLASFAAGAPEPDLLPWAGCLSPEALHRLRGDLTLLLTEPDLTGEPVDWPELEDVLREYAELAAWDGPLFPQPEEPQPEAVYRVDVRPQDLRALGRASAAVRRAAEELLIHHLPTAPTAGDHLGASRLKKLSNRDVWQAELPDGYRLRFYVAERERVVYVVYLGPHPDGAEAGREQTVRASVQRGRHGG